MFSTLSHLIATFFLGLATLFGATTPTLGAAVPVTPALFETSLASPITSTATTMTLSDGTLSDGTSLSGYMCFTIDSGNPNVEYVCGTASGTSVTSLTRGVSPLTGTTTVSSLEYSHRRGADVKITDYPTIGILANIIRGVDTIPSLLNYANTVLIGPSSASTTVATKYYVDNVAIAGAPDANTTTKGIVQFATGLQAASSTATGSTGALLALGNGIATDTPSVPRRVSGSHVIMSTIGGYLNQAWLDLTANFSPSGTWAFSGPTTYSATSTASANTIGFNEMQTLTASTTIAKGNAVFIATSTGAVLVSDNTAHATSTLYFSGFAKTAATNGNSVVVQTGGIVSGLSGLTTGATYYVGSAGALTTSITNNAVQVGTALSSTTLLIQKSEQNYVGSVSLSGTGSTANIGTSDWKRISGHLSVAGTASNANEAIQGDITLTPQNTSSTVSYITQIAAGSTASASVGLALSGTTLTLTCSVGQSATINTCTATVYIYR